MSRARRAAAPRNPPSKGPPPVARTLNYVLGFALLGAIVMSLLAPLFNYVLLSPPKSFGTNCEPAAEWSTTNIHRAELVGLIFGAGGGIGFAIYQRKRRNAKAAQATPTERAAQA
jgi:hypothetical protein